MTAPVRTCVVCRKEGGKSEFIRVVRTKSGDISVDGTGKAAGRGAYVCKTCAAAAKKKRALDRAFKQKVPEELYDALERAAQEVQ